MFLRDFLSDVVGQLAIALFTALLQVPLNLITAWLTGGAP